MRNTARIFIIIGMILGAIAIVPVIVGAIALKKLSNATTSSELTGIGVVTLLFCSIIGGILLLCLKDVDLE